MPWWQCFECMTHRDVDDVRCLDFSHRLLHDVPADVFAYERTLEELHLNANRIADLPRQLFYCQELRVLNLNDNELVALPPAISSLTSLQRLSLSKNALNGIVENIKGCKHLQMLDISLNGFQKLPEPVTSVISLQELYLNDTSLEALPANFGRLVNLRILEMRDNMLNTLPKSMARLQQLQRLDIGSNEFTELPEVIGQLVNLTELWLDGNRVRRISANVGNLTKLVHFEASNNLLTHLPNEVANWSRLLELSISVNDFKQLPFSIGMMKSLVTLKADENNLQELPDSISQLENLEEIMVSHNDLFRLPASIGLLRKLRFLTADENLLRALPSELCSCVALTILSVRGNKLTEVPVDIGHLRNLKVFSIVNNFVTHLPVSVLNLQQLSALWISDNQSQPLMPLQKDFGPEQSVRLTCFMLPQTAGGGGGGGGKQNGLMHDKERLDTLRLHLTAKQMADYDENAPIMSSPPPPGAHGHGDDPTVPNATGGPSKRRICFASDPVSATNDAAARLMRSPTPYPKELRILAKYARYVHTNGQTEYVHVDDLRAAGGEPIGVGDTTDGIELLEQQRQLEQHQQHHQHQQQQQQQHYQQQQQVPSPPINGQQPQHHVQEHPNQDGSDHDSGAVGSASAIIPHIDDTSASASLRYEELNRYAPPTHLPPNFQPTLSPLLGDDELDARAAYFYATAEQKITTPVPQILDYENVSACSSSLRPSLLGAASSQSQQPIYGTAPLPNGIGQVTTAERPASEVRMSQASSFNDAGSLSSAFGMTAALNGTRSPAIMGQQQHPQQYYPTMNGAGGMVVAQLDEDVVYYSTSQGSESNYGQLPANNWQQQQHLQQQQQHLAQHHPQMATAAAQPIYGMSPHLNHSDRVSVASDYARSELSSVVSGMMTPQQQQQQQQPQQPLLRQPPPYHIARAYTKKSKSDLMHYEQFRHTGSLNGDAAESPTLSNGHGPFYASDQPEKDTGNPPQQHQQQFYSNGSGIYANSDGQLEAVQYQQHQQQMQQLHQQTESIYVSRSTPNRTQPLQHPMHSPQAAAPLAAIVANGGAGMVDSNRNPEQNGAANGGGAEAVGAASALPSPTNSAAGANGVASPPPGQSANNSKSPWLFGQHKNPKVLQLSVPKTLDIGFQLTQPPTGNGIFVGEVDANSIVNTLLRRHDKILDMDGVDFTGIALADALTVLSNAGAVINVMVSRI